MFQAKIDITLSDGRTTLEWMARDTYNSNRYRMHESTPPLMLLCISLLGNEGDLHWVKTKRRMNESEIPRLSRSLSLSIVSSIECKSGAYQRIHSAKGHRISSCPTLIRCSYQLICCWYLLAYLNICLLNPLPNAKSNPNNGQFKLQSKIDFIRSLYS